MKKYYFFLLIVIITLSCNSPEKEYQKAIAENTIQAFEDFLDKYPNSEFTKDAKNKIISMEYAVADSINTIDAYNQFIQKYPDSEYREEVKLKISDLNNSIRIKKLKENTGWEIKRVWDAKNIKYSKMIYSVSRIEGSTTSKPNHYLAVIEFHQYKKKEVEFKTYNIKVTDSLLNNYYPVGIAPFSINEYVPLEIFSITDITLYFLGTENGAIFTITEDGKISFKESSELIFFLVYNIPKKFKRIDIKILNYDPVSFKIEN